MLGALLVLLSGCSSAPERAGGDFAQGDGQGVPDAVPKVEPHSRYGNAASYVVFGKRYYTKDDSTGHVERGVASWYGPGFHGRKTSSGERYDMHAMTAAHKTLPLPTYARVTNLENGRSAVVRINDRGPFHGPRVIDLSHAAAAKLGVLAKGTAKVEVQALDPAAPQPAAPNPFLVAANKPEPQPFLDGFDGPVSAARNADAPSGQGRPAAEPAIADASGSTSISRIAPLEFEPVREPAVARREVAKAKPERARRPAAAPAKRSTEVQVAVAAEAAKGKADVEVAAADAKSAKGKAGPSEAQPDRAKTLADAGAKPAKAERGGGNMYLQVGAFGDRSNAEHLRKRLSKELARLQVQVRSIGGDSASLYKVQVGPLMSRAKASDVSQQLVALGVTRSHVVVE
jgi:rare lipoprotein A